MAGLAGAVSVPFGGGGVAFRSAQLAPGRNGAAHRAEALDSAPRGHGIGSTRAQYNAERADTLAFLPWQMDQPEFQRGP